MKTVAASGGEANLEIIMSHSHKHYSALTVNGPATFTGHLYEKPGKVSESLVELRRTNRLLACFLSLSLSDFPPVLFEVSMGPLVCQVRGRAREKARAEERSRTAPTPRGSAEPVALQGRAWRWEAAGAGGLGPSRLRAARTSGRVWPSHPLRPLRSFGTLPTYPSGRRSAHPQSPLRVCSGLKCHR